MNKPQDQNDYIRQVCLPIPESICDHAPLCVKQALAPSHTLTSTMRDMGRSALYMATLANYSALMPGVTFDYGFNHYSTNLSFVLASTAASGKSIINFTEQIPSRVSDFMMEQSKAEQKEWEVQCIEWENEKRNAQKGGYKPDTSKMPGNRPELAMLCVPATVSKSQLLLTMEASQRYGNIIQSSEIQSIIDCLGKEYAAYADVLCKGSANEKIDQLFKVDGRPIRIPHAKLSFVLAGTISQAQRFLPTSEDGLSSRPFMYLAVGEEAWVSQRPRKIPVSYSDIFAQLADDAFHMWQLLSSRRITITFTDSQWDLHDSLWAEEKGQLIVEAGAALTALANRHGQNAMRLAAVLTVLRWWESVRDAYTHRGAEFDYTSLPHELTCSDTDFRDAMTIARTLLSHALCFATGQHHDTVRPLTDWRWTDTVLNLLPRKFTATDFVAVAKTRNKQKTVAYNALKSLEASGRITMLKERDASHSKEYLKVDS